MIQVVRYQIYRSKEVLIKEFKDIDNLSHGDFEIFVRDLLVASGWNNAEITKVGDKFKYGDGGVDIFASKGGKRFAIEVKQRGSNYTVDVKALNQLVTDAVLANVSNKILITNSYFTSEVIVRALRLGVELIDREQLKNLWVMKHSEIGRDIKPRKYQEDVINEALQHYYNGKSKLLIEMATGLGKTYTVAHIIKKIIKESPHKQRVLFLAHQVEILLQSVTAFKNVLGIGTYSFSACISGSEPENTDFVFASFDTLYGQISELNKLDFDYIVVDEAHHTPATTYSQVVENFTPKLLIGLTATPYRADNKDVLSFFGGSDGHIGKFDLVWALKHRKLAYPKYLVLLDDINQEKINQLERGLTVSDLDKNLFLHKKDEEVVRIIEKTVVEQEIENVKGIIFCRNIKHMKHLMSFFELGTATMVHSKMSSFERRENIRNFREGDYKYILVCDLFNEGIDIPETNVLVFMRSTGSKTIWLQQLGRGLRKTPNKEFVHVLDFVGSIGKLNEIKEFVKDIERVSFDKESFEFDKYQSSDVYHDSSIEVSYSSGAARVLELLESLKLKINSREILLDKLRYYFNLNETVPDINQLEDTLEDVSLDQVATHFGSYYSYLVAALEDKVHSKPMADRLNNYIVSYCRQNMIGPTIRALTNYFMVKQLYEFSEKDLNSILPNFTELVELALQEVAVDKAADKKNTESTEEDEIKFLREFKDSVSTRADIKKLLPDELKEINSRYNSTSIFLKKLKDIKNNEKL